MIRLDGNRLADLQDRCRARSPVELGSRLDVILAVISDRSIAYVSYDNVARCLASSLTGVSMISSTAIYTYVKYLRYACGCETGNS